jgi:sortase (surface protein transpeptidase)
MAATRAAVAALTMLVVAFLAGCGTATGRTPEPVAATPAAPPAAIAPASVEVPRLGITSSLVPLGLNPDGTIAVPSLDEPMQASWYSEGPAPGEVGPAVVLGHVDARGEPGIFHRLREVAEGDEITIGRADGTALRFVVTRVAQVAKAEFPTAEVYGPTAEPQLRLITCGGSFDRAAGHYRDNVIVFARLA